MNDDQRYAIRRFAQDYKDNGFHLENALVYWQVRSQGFVDPADQPECEDIIKNQAPEGA